MINVNKLEKWLISKRDRIGDFKSSSEEKYLINSFWAEDTKMHMALFPKYGKYGGYKDFKTSKSGTIINLIMEIDNVSLKDALKTIYDDNYIYGKNTNVKSSHANGIKINMPEGAISMFSKNVNSKFFNDALQYLNDRSLMNCGYEFFFCTQDIKLPNGKTQYIKHRILIPFKNEHNIMEYWTARSINKNDKIRYVEISGDMGGIKKQETLFSPSLKNTVGKTALVVEGPIDCISVYSSGVPCISIQGSQLYPQQIEKIKKLNINPIFAFDNDKAGLRALIKSIGLFNNARFILSPVGYDWNKLLIEGGRENLKSYIINNIKTYDNNEAAIKKIQIMLG